MMGGFGEYLRSEAEEARRPNRRLALGMYGVEMIEPIIVEEHP